MLQMKNNKLFALLLGLVALIPLILEGNGTVLLILAPVIGILLFSKHDYVKLQYGDPRGRD